MADPQKIFQQNWQNKVVGIKRMCTDWLAKEEKGMSLDVIDNQSQEKELLLQFPVFGWVRAIFGLYVITMPIFSFWAIQLLQPQWQSGKFSDYLALFLQPGAAIIFLFLLAYSITCYLFFLMNSERYSPSFVIRLGVYTGVVLALQYSLLLLLYILDDRFSLTIFLLWLFPLYFPKIYYWAVGKWNEKNVHLSLAIFAIIAFLIALVIFREPFLPLFLVFAALVATAPFWSFLMANQAALWLYKNYENKPTIPRGLGITSWLAAYAVAWRYDVLKMYEMYAQLPTEPPNCYVATAAAQGHPKFVRSRTVLWADGNSVQVNQQLRIFKCAELALIAVIPRLHQFIREAYDVTGKPLA